MTAKPDLAEALALEIEDYGEPTGGNSWADRVRALGRELAEAHAAKADVTDADVSAVFAGTMLDMRRKLTDVRERYAAALDLLGRDSARIASLEAQLAAAEKKVDEMRWALLDWSSHDHGSEPAAEADEQQRKIDGMQQVISGFAERERELRAQIEAAKREPAVEADGIDWKRRAADAEAELQALIQFRSGSQLDTTRLRRQEPTAMAALGDAVTECDALRAQLAAAKEDAASWRRVAEGLQTQLEAAAPLFEAAHVLNDACSPTLQHESAEIAALLDWARSKHGQDWKAGRNG